MLTDFGFSKVTKASDEKSRSFCGSAAYAAPEIIQGIPYKPTSHDTWSLGVVLFIMVCGTMPFDDSNVRQMVKEQLAHKIRYPPQAAYNLSSQCKDLIEKMIQPNPEIRLSINQIRAHPWIANTIYKSELSGASTSAPRNSLSTEAKPTETAAEESREKQPKNSQPDFWF